VKPLNHPLLCLGTELPTGRFLQMIRHLRGCPMQKSQVLVVTFAPDANQVSAIAILDRTLSEGGSSKESDARRDISAQVGVWFHTQTTQRFFRASMKFHNCFPNQFVSRQRLNAMRARWASPTGYFSEMFNIRQISRLSTPSTSRNVKTVRCFSASCWNNRERFSKRLAVQACAGVG